MTQDRLVIATRGSALALWQANHVKDRLAAIAPELAVELLVIKTSGDQILDVPLAKVGGKGLFVKEIEEALLDESRRPRGALDEGRAAAAGRRAVARGGVEARDPVGRAVRPRAGHRSTRYPSAPRSARRACGGSASCSRAARTSRSRCCAATCRRGSESSTTAMYDAIVLAAAGLTRLGMADRITQVLPLELSIPAVAQGVLGIETRDNDLRARRLASAAIHDERESAAVTAERAFLAKMGGSCTDAARGPRARPRRRRDPARRHVRHARRLEDPARRVQRSQRRGAAAR